MMNNETADDFPWNEVVAEVPDSEFPDVVDSATAAEMLNVTVNNLRQMVYLKQISVHERLGRKCMFLRRDVEALMVARQAKRKAVV